jgi:hypothetical protein
VGAVVGAGETFPTIIVGIPVAFVGAMVGTTVSFTSMVVGTSDDRSDTFMVGTNVSFMSTKVGVSDTFEVCTTVGINVALGVGAGVTVGATSNSMHPQFWATGSWTKGQNSGGIAFANPFSSTSPQVTRSPLSVMVAPGRVTPVSGPPQT